MPFPLNVHVLMMKLLSRCSHPIGGGWPCLFFAFVSMATANNPPVITTRLPGTTATLMEGTQTYSGNLQRFCRPIRGPDGKLIDLVPKLLKNAPGIPGISEQVICQLPDTTLPSRYSSTSVTPKPTMHMTKTKTATTTSQLLSEKRTDVSGSQTGSRITALAEIGPKLAPTSSASPRAIMLDWHSPFTTSSSEATTFAAFSMLPSSTVPTSTMGKTTPATISSMPITTSHTARNIPSSTTTSSSHTVSPTPDEMLNSPLDSMSSAPISSRTPTSDHTPSTSTSDARTENPEAFFKFENNVDDSSENGHDGQTDGFITFKDGVCGQAAFFDGNSTITSVGFEWGTSFSVSIWFRASLTESLQGILKDGIGNWKVWVSNTVFRAFLNTRSFCDGGTGSLITGSIELNQWLHFALTFNGSQAYGYMNGTRIAVKPETSYCNLDTTTPVIIGKAEESYRYFNGLIDELRIYRQAITESEVKELFESPCVRLR